MLPASAQPTGLSETEAAARLKREGANELPQEQRRTSLRILRDVLREPMFALLLGAAVIYLVIGELLDAIVLIGFATTSVSIALIQEARTERILESLRDLSSPRALVIRGGIEGRIPGRAVVRGDIVVLAEGDRVPADATVLAAQDLQADESLLTGESVPVRKTEKEGTEKAPAPGGDDLPFVYAGSLIVRGHGLAEVTATGPRSQLGRIGLAIARIETEPPRLRAQTQRLVARFAVISLSVSAVATILYGFLRGSWLEAALSGIALSMSMLPEEFPLVLTVFMVAGAWRISHARVLTRRIAAIETLGAATVLCTDKTGTLTENCMVIAELRVGAERWVSAEPRALSESFRVLLQFGVLASLPSAIDPMDKAFHALAEEQLQRHDTPGAERTLKWEYGLQPDLLAVTQIWDDPAQDRLIAAAKGAPEAIAELCRLEAGERADLQSALDAMSEQGIRVLAVARTTLLLGTERPASPRDIPFEFLGLVGLADPLRSSVPAAVEECHAAGIKIVMITGDYAKTASAIAVQAGIALGTTMTGGEIAALDEAELRNRVVGTGVFARILPEQKLRIVEALKANGEIVAMTGDGVNDAPSLKAAHIGIAMGGRGTDVAREAADLVLLDDDFAAIVTAVRLGRRIYDNLRKSMAYIIAVHVPIAGLALIPLLFGLPLVFLPLHIAFLEMVIDPICSIAFEAEPAERDVMRRPPRDPQAPLFTISFIAWSLLQGVVVLAVVAGLFVAALRSGLPEADVRALAFAALVATNAGLVLVNRSESRSLLAAFRQRNPALWWMLGATSAILAAILLIAPARHLFGFGPLHGDDVAIAVAAGITALLLLDLLKRRLGPGREPVPG
jgi:P-type Ca2+ transporter type 2C